MIRSTYRFHGHGSLRYVYTRGTAVRSRHMVCKYVEGRRNTPRVAVVISKKVLKSAVGRNRVRRRIFEAIRLQLPVLKPRSDIVLIVTSADVITISHEELTQSLARLLTQADLYKTPKI